MINDAIFMFMDSLLFFLLPPSASLYFFYFLVSSDCCFAFYKGERKTLFEIFGKLKDSLKKTKDSMMNKIESAFKRFSKIDEEFFNELEEILIFADVGVATTEKICKNLKDVVKKNKLTDPKEIKDNLREILAKTLSSNDETENEQNKITSPHAVLVVGVNGVGKTTTIGKLANMYKKDGRKVLLSAADTFRAAAIDQLEIWANRTGVSIVKQKEGADPAAVLYDSINAAKSRKVDIILCDTAGRLHNKKNLMDELAKLNRVINKNLENSYIETLLVIDATTGQNAVSQVKEFKDVTNITGLVLTKLDGTAKGGIVFAIKNELNVPIKYIGTGEGIDDIEPFNAKEFVDALFED